MRLYSSLLLAISGVAVSFPSDQNTDQHPIIQPNDNLNLTPIRDALVSNKVIGDVLDDFEPTYYIDLVYPKHQTHVLLGNEIEPKYLQERPTLTIHRIPTRNSIENKNTGIDKTFTLALTDPDATSRYDPKWSEMCHWIVTNLTAPTSESSVTMTIPLDLGLEDIIIGQDSNAGLPHARKSNCKEKKHQKQSKSKKQDKCLENELVSYFPPAPPPKTGFHRYVFVLLEGDATHLKPPEERKHWGYGKVRHGVRDWAAENHLTVVGANFFFSLNKKQR